MFCLFWHQMEDGAVLYNIWPGAVMIHNGQIEFTPEFGLEDLWAYKKMFREVFFDC